MNFKYIAKTDVGKKRDHNEDAYGVYSEQGLLFVCDGMGGHAAGDYASQKVVETIVQLMKAYRSSADLEEIMLKQPSDVPRLGRVLSTLVMIANRRVFNLAVMYPKLRGMGTTFASVLFDQGYVNVVHVGDSRVYRLRDHKLTQLTTDHSWIEELRQDGEIREQEIGHFREKNVITRALGTNPSTKVDWKGCKLKERDVYLLCTDGLCGEIDDNTITGILNENKDDLDKAASELINAANDAGGSDNITVILVKVQEDIPQHPPVKMNEIITLSLDEEFYAGMDSYIEKNYPLLKTKVPKGVKREKRRLYKNPLIVAVSAVLILFSIVVFIKKPWKAGVAPSDITHGDILIRTNPAGANVKLYAGGYLVEQKPSPADFLSLEEDKYIIEIEKTGYEKKKLTITVIKGMQKLQNVNLTAHAEIQLSLGISPGFNPTDQVYIDDKLCEYYGKPLTIQRIGVVGKDIRVERGRNYKIKVGDFEKIITVTREQDIVKLKFENGDITIEESKE